MKDLIPCTPFFETSNSGSSRTHEELKMLPVNNVSNFPLYIQSLGITFPDPKYRIIRERSSLNVLEYVRSGKGIIDHNGKNIEVHAGDVYLLHMNECHHYWADPNEPYEKIWINFCSAPIDSFISNSSLCENIVFHNTNLGKKIEQIYQLISSSLYLSEICHEVLSLMFSIVVELEKHSASAKTSAMEASITRALNVHAMNPSTPISCMTQELFLSNSKFYREFCKIYKTSPQEYVINLRLERAKSLLTETDNQVGEIARLVGFNDAHYFSYFFKKKVGKTPLEYRKASRLSLTKK